MRKQKSDIEILQSIGGTVEIAKKLGVSPQRVTNWKKRGVPPAIKIKHKDIFLK